LRPPKRFETERLYLRRPVIEDATSIFEQYAQDKEVTKYLTWKPHQSIKDTSKFLKRCSKAWKEGTSFPWAIVRKSDNHLLGMIEIVAIDHAGALVGFVLAKRYWDSGYMTETLKAVIDWCLNQKRIFRVWAFCDVENRSSARVMEKAGMQREGILRRWIKLPQLGDKPRDCFCYSIVK
jgi:RimJ/RimL family protein N-acetyltransferase